MANTEVLVPDVELSIHTKDSTSGFAVSKTIIPGESFPMSELADYQQRAIRSGKVKGARVMEQADFERLKALAIREAGEEDTPLVIDLGEQLADD